MLARPATASLRAHGSLALATAVIVGGAAGCGTSQPTARHAPPAHTLDTTTTLKLTPAAARKQAIAAKVDASSDSLLASGKVHIAQGAPSDAEVKREVQELLKKGITLPSGSSVASFESEQSEAAITAAGAERPETVWNPLRKPIADWIVPVLQWAYEHGWRGYVTSGYRTYFEQEQLNAAGAFSAPAGYSNHETTAYPGGAVDVTEPSQLIVVLRGYPGPEKLIGGVLGPVDPEHFSATGD